MLHGAMVVKGEDDPEGALLVVKGAEGALLAVKFAQPTPSSLPNQRRHDDNVRPVIRGGS